MTNTTYAKGDVVRLSGESGKRYRIVRIRLDGTCDIVGRNGMRTVDSSRIIAAPGDHVEAISWPAPARKGRR